MSDINCCGKEEYYGEVLPNWSLVRLVECTQPLEVGSFSMTENSWGLTRFNYPSFVFDMKPCLDDETGVSNYALLVYSHYEKRLVGHVYEGYKLVKACIEAGWDETEGGLACWLADRMYRHLERLNWKPEVVYD